MSAKHLTVIASVFFIGLIFGGVVFYTQKDETSGLQPSKNDAPIYVPELDSVSRDGVVVVENFTMPLPTSTERSAEPIVEPDIVPATQIADQTLTEFDGYYRIIKPDSDNFDTYLKAVGVNWLLRTAGRGINQDIRFTGLGNQNFRIETISFLKSSNQVFTLDEPLKFDTMDMRTVDGLWRLQSNDPPNLHLLETWANKQGTQSWIMRGPNLHLTLCCDNKCASRVYQRQQE